MRIILVHRQTSSKRLAPEVYGYITLERQACAQSSSSIACVARGPPNFSYTALLISRTVINFRWLTA